MEAEKQDLLDIMFDNKRQYIIPVYQRNYDWKKDNCKVLFDDVIMAYKEAKSHFLGTIVQVQQDEENNIKKFIIIDGQQRMTSIYLLLKALYDSNPNENEKEELERLLFNIKNNKILAKDDKLKLKLKPIKTDNIQFVLLMDNKFDEINKVSNIYLNYEYFKTLINKELKNEITIKNILTGLKKLNIVMISLKEPADDPQVVFERINSTGEDLTLADLIRNYILMTDKNMEQLYDDYWLPIETKIGKDNLVDFFQTYLIFKLPDNSKEQYYSFKNYVSKMEISHEDLLIEMKRLSKYYFAFTYKSSDYSTKINDLLEGFRFLKQTTIFSFLFSIFDDYENKLIDEDILCDVLKFFLNYTLRRAVVGIPTNSLRGLYKTLYRRIFDSCEKKKDYIKTIYSFMASITSKDAVPNDTLFKDKLMNENLYKNKDMCRYILSILENGLYTSKEKVVIDKTISIEHILPQNRENIDWQKDLGTKFSAVYDKYLNTLGNLTLTGYNSELSDKPFNVKKKLIIDKYSKFTYLNSDVVSESRWDDVSIKCRAERLSSRILDIFKLDEIFKKKIELGENRHFAGDGKDLSNLKPDHFILLGENRFVKSAAEMLCEVCTILFNLDSKTMENLAKENYSGGKAERPLLTIDKSLLRQPKEIDNSGIFVEANKSFNDVSRAIKILLEEFDLNSDDFVFYTK